MLLKISLCIPKPDLRHCFPSLVLLNTLYKSFFFSFFSFSFQYHRFYLVNILLHFYFRVQVPLKYPCEILFWISREILKTIITYTFINPVFSDPFDDVESLKNENQTVQNMWEHKITKTDLAILNHRNIRTTATKR